ncbi:MAG: FecR domain-containing protein [Prevotellaceae bacterium]|jgi:ferric-dicitrate binding protein FerR (iron transport regulator)|nr:FecR domain-containing protein [Prevotellaceae bacterium]
MEISDSDKRGVPLSDEDVRRWINGTSEDWKEVDEKLHSYWNSMELDMEKEAAHSSLQQVKARLGWTNKSVHAHKVVSRRNMIRAAAVMIPFAAICGCLLYQNNQSVEKAPTMLVCVPSEQQEMHLTDGSKVWVNTNSRIAYTQADKARVAELSGEAFFEVKKDTIPFIVKAGDLGIKVLGTSFDIKAYPEKKCIKVTLLDGTVEATTQQGEKYTLRPFKQLIYNTESHQVKVVELDQNDVVQLTAWRREQITLHAVTLNQILNVLKSAYNVRFIIKEKHLHNTDTYNLCLQKKTDLKVALQVLCEMIDDLTYEMQPDGVVILEEKGHTTMQL